MKKVVMKWKTLFIAAALVLASTAAALAQDGQPAPQGPPAGGNAPGDRVEALRVWWITKELNLTPQEAEKFWPVYNSYRADLEGMRRSFKPGQELTADQQLDFEQKKLDLKKKYKPQFEGALGHDKLNQLYNLERKFQEKLKEMREQRMQQRGNGPGLGGRQGGPRN